VIAALLGAAAQFVQNPRVGQPRTKYDWAIVAAVAFIMGLFVGAIKPYGPRWEGIYVATAVIAAVFWGGVAAYVLRFVKREEDSAEG
jgi:hypothetical protein